MVRSADHLAGQLRLSSPSWRKPVDCGGVVLETRTKCVSLHKTWIGWFPRFGKVTVSYRAFGTRLGAHHCSASSPYSLLLTVNQTKPLTDTYTKNVKEKPQDYGQIAKRRHGNGQHHFDSNKVDLMSFQRPQETTPTSGKAGVLKKGKNVLKQMFRHGAEKEVCQACVIIHLRAQMIVLSTPRRRLLRDLHKK